MKVSANQIRQFPWLEAGLAFLTLLFLFPHPYLLVPNLDSSWQAVLEEAFFNKWQFGKDIIFTGGPLSLLYSPTSNGYYPILQVFAESLVLFLAIFAIFNALRHQPGWIHGIIFVSLFCASAAGNDGIFLSSIAAVSFRLLGGNVKIHWIVCLYFFVAILSLMKFSFAVMGLGCSVLLSLYNIWQKDYKTAAILLGTYLLILCCIWMAVGQTPINLPAYYINSFSIANGHLWSMHNHERASVFLALVLILLLASIPILVWAIRNGHRPVNWAILGVSAITLFLTWKAGIVRPDHHLTFFLQGSVLLPAMILQFIEPKRWAHNWVLLCFISFFLSCFWMVPTNREHTINRAFINFQKGIQTITNPGSVLTHFSDVIPLVKSDHNLPRIQDRVGQESIDVLLYHQGILLLNNLNYQPRPTVQSYVAYNEHLAGLNYKHMLDNPPHYILNRIGVIDGRYATVEDNLYYREFLQRYIPVFTEKEFLLLERSPRGKKFTEEVSVLQTKILSGENVDVSKFTDHPLWVKVNYKPSFLHKTQAIFYKPEILLMRITTNKGEDRNVRLVGPNLKIGFLLSPYLETNDDISNFLTTNQSLTYIESFTIVSIPGRTLFSTREFEIEVIQLKREEPLP